MGDTTFASRKPQQASESDWECGENEGVQIDLQPKGQDRVEAVFSCGSGTLRDCTTLRYKKQPLGGSVTSFEIEVLRCSTEDELFSIALGVVSCLSPLACSMPGWELGDVGVHCDDGKLYSGSGDSAKMPVFCDAGVGVGDRFACSLEYTESTNKKHDGVVGISFSRNDVPIGWPVVQAVPEGGFFPGVGLLGPGAAVSIKVNTLPETSREETQASQSEHTLSSMKTLGTENNLSPPTSGHPGMLSTQSMPVCSNYTPPPASQPLDWGHINEHVEMKDDNSLCYKGRGLVITDVGIGTSFKPLLSGRSYFEVKVVDCGERSRIAVGLCASSSAQLSLPGWYQHSVAYHGDDGYVFFGSAENGLPLGRKLRTGDTVGCGLKFLEQTESNAAVLKRPAMVFFTLNSALLGTPLSVEIPSGGFYPVVALLSRGERVSACYRTFSRSLSHQPHPTVSVNETVVPQNDNRKKDVGSIDDTLSHQSTTSWNIPLVQRPDPPETQRQPPAEVASVPSIPKGSWSHGINITQLEKSSGGVHAVRLDFSGHDQRIRTPEYIHCDEPLAASCSAFKAVMDDTAVDGRIAIGVMQHTDWKRTSTIPPNSVFLCLTDGMLMVDGSSHYFAPACKPGDEIVCALVQSAQEDSTGAELVFSHNGRSLGSIKTSLPKNHCCPAVVLCRNGDAVIVHRDPCLVQPAIWPSCVNMDIDVDLGIQKHVSVQGNLISSSASGSTTGIFQLRHALTAFQPYVEVQVVCQKYPFAVTIGVVNGNRTLEVDVPGRVPGSVGFCNGHVVSWPEGARTASSRKIQSTSTKHSAVRHMDTLGVGIDPLPSSRGASKTNIFFTHNGRVVDSFTWGGTASLLPTVGLTHATGVLVDMNSKWPLPVQSSLQWSAINRLQQKQDLLCYSHEGENDGDVGTAIASHAFSVSQPYFEVEIVDSGRGCFIGVGAANSAGTYRGMVGWEAGSVGFHSDDGILFQGQGNGAQFAPTSQQGDIIGCGVEFGAATNDGVSKPQRLFMTRNHQIIGYASCPPNPSPTSLSSRVMFHPMVSLHSQGAVVRTRLGLNWPPQQCSLGPGFGRGHLIRFISPSTYVYTGKKCETYDTGSIQAASPMTPESRYFEVTVSDFGTDGRIGIGLASASYPFGHQPGWSASTSTQSIALHVDDGEVFTDGRHSVLCTPSVQGDVIGCGILYPKQQPSRSDGNKKAALSSDKKAQQSAVKNKDNIQVFFSRNGKILGFIESKMPRHGFFPTVGLHSEGAKVQVNLKAVYPPVCPLGSMWQQSARLQCNNAGKTLDYTGRCSSQNDRGIAIAKHPLDQERSFFAVTLLASGSFGGDVTIGVVNENSVEVMLQPGEATTSVGFHASSGGLFVAGQPTRLCSAPCRANDVIGCGIEYSLSIAPGRLQGSSKVNSHVYFTVNGKVVARTRLACSPYLLYPTVSLHGVGDKVQVDLTDPPVLARAKHRTIGWARSHEVQLHGSMVRHLSSSGALHRKTGTIGVAQAVLFDTSGNEQFFEAILMASGKPCNVFLGFGPLDMPVVQGPGTSPGCVMLSLATGSVSNGSYTPRPCCLGPISAGDRFGCYICWTGSETTGTSLLPKRAVLAVFVHNRREVCRCLVKLPEGADPCDLLPTVALRGRDEEVFVSVPDAQVPPAIRRSDWLQLAGIKCDEKKCCCSSIDTSQGSSQLGGAQLCTPLMSDKPMLKVKCLTETSGVFAGVAPALYSFSEPPGHGPDSLGCDLACGKIFSEGLHIADCPPFVEDDEFGLALDFSEPSILGGSPYYAVIITKNGVVVGRTTVCVEKGQPVYPAISMASGRASVELGIVSSMPRQLFPMIGWMQLKRVAINSHGHYLRYGGTGTNVKDYGVAIAAQALSPKMNYFETTLCATGRDGAIAVGLVHPEYNCDYMPGWQPLSVAYHADDGGIFTGCGQTDRFTASCRHLDVMGCGIDFSAETAAGKMEVFFTRNRQVVATESMSVPTTGLFPCVAMMSPGECVYVDFVPWQVAGRTILNVVNDTAR